MFFSRKRKKIERVLVVDIGSGSVGVAIATAFNTDSKIPALVEAILGEALYQGEAKTRRAVSGLLVLASC